MSAPHQYELDLQAAVTSYLDVVMPNWVAWTAFPAGGGGRLRGALLKAMGLKPGWPDLIFIKGGRFYGIELKTGAGRLSADQIAVHVAIKNASADVAVCRSVEEVERTLTEWGFALRGRVSA